MASEASARFRDIWILLRFVILPIRPRKGETRARTHERTETRPSKKENRGSLPAFRGARENVALFYARRAVTRGEPRAFISCSIRDRRESNGDVRSARAAEPREASRHSSRRAAGYVFLAYIFFIFAARSDKIYICYAPFLPVSTATPWIS